MNRTSSYKRGLFWFATLSSLWVFVLVSLGAFTTTIGAGMAFPDWPLSNGSVNPHGWLTQIDKFAEHSHRISATVMGIITTILAVWLWRTEARIWLRKLAWFALALVIVQGVVGGLRVLLDHFEISMIDTNVGRLFAMSHAFLAQTYVCTLFAIALACSRPWIEQSAKLHGAPSEGLKRIGRLCVVLLFVQLSIAAVVRHSFAGLAIPTFPKSTFDGQWLPAHWDFRVATQFIHRCMAGAIGVAILVYAYRLLRKQAAPPILRGLGILLVSLVLLQIRLGAQIIWTNRSVYMTTGHVVVGALTLATTFLVTFVLHRTLIERDVSPPA